MSSTDPSVPPPTTTSSSASTWSKKFAASHTSSTPSSSSSSTSSLATPSQNSLSTHNKSNTATPNNSNKAGNIYQQDQRDVQSTDFAREAEILNTIRISTVLPSLAVSKRKKEEMAKGTKVCYDYTKGRCHYGNKCRFIHIDNYQNSFLPNTTAASSSSSASAATTTISSSSIPLPSTTLPAVTNRSLKKLGDGDRGITATGITVSTVQEEDVSSSSSTRIPPLDTKVDNTSISAHVLYKGLEMNGRTVLRQFANVRSEKLSSLLPTNSPTIALNDELMDSLPALTTSYITPLTPIHRYYTPLYAPDVGNGEIQVPLPSGTGTKTQSTLSCSGTGNRGEDQYVYLQSNRTCIVGIAPSHPILRYRIPITKVQFVEQFKNLTVIGKRKKGGIFLEPNAGICTITLADGRSYILRSCIRASLIEVNTRLENEPYLLNNPYLAATQGWLAIMNVRIERVVDLQISLLNEEKYQELCTVRQLPSTPDEVLRWIPVKNEDERKEDLKIHENIRSSTALDG